MNRVIRNWHFMRVLRAGLAVLIIIQGFQVHNYMSLVFGSFFLGMAIFNVGCCGPAGCATNDKASDEVENKPVVFEEVRSSEKRIS